MLTSNVGNRKMKMRLVQVCVVCSVVAMSASCRTLEPEFCSGDAFLPTIADADRIVVRDGGVEKWLSVRKHAILFTVTEQNEVNEVRSHLNFTTPFSSACMCVGYPGIDWYRGKKRLALTAVKHGQGLACKRSKGYHAMLEPESQMWLANWLASHGVETPKKE